MATGRVYLSVTARIVRGYTLYRSNENSSSRGKCSRERCQDQLREEFTRIVDKTFVVATLVPSRTGRRSIQAALAPGHPPITGTLSQIHTLPWLRS